MSVNWSNSKTIQGSYRVVEPVVQVERTCKRAPFCSIL